MMRVVDEGIMIISKALHLHRRFYWIIKPVNPTTLDSISMDNNKHVVHQLTVNNLKTSPTFGDQ